MNTIEYLTNKLSIEKTKYDIAIRNGNLEQQGVLHIRIELLEEIINSLIK